MENENQEINSTVKNRKPLRFYLGNLLILVSLSVLGYIYFPIIRLYFYTPPVQAIEEVKRIEKGFYIYIPKINGLSEVIENVDPWNQKVYKDSLKKGVAHAKGTYLPGENGTIFLFAHSSAAPWELTRTNTPFLKLGQLNIGDEIKIIKDGNEFNYKVTSKFEIWPNETQYLKDLSKKQLILQTCTPIGTDIKRLLVFAEPEN